MNIENIEPVQNYVIYLNSCWEGLTEILELCNKLDIVLANFRKVDVLSLFLVTLYTW